MIIVIIMAARVSHTGGGVSGPCSLLPFLVNLLVIFLYFIPKKNIYTPILFVEFTIVIYCVSLLKKKTFTTTLGRRKAIVCTRAEEHILLFLLPQVSPQ